jgi:hypothetical protein
MFLAPHHMPLEIDGVDVFAPFAATKPRRWRWICGSRFEGVRWL